MKNPAFKAGTSAKVDRIVFRYIAGASQFQALKSREGDVVDAVSPQIQIVDFYKDTRLQGGGRTGLPVGAPGLPAGRQGSSRAQEEVRPPGDHPGHQPGKIREVLYVKTGLVGSTKELPVLQSHVFKPFEKDSVSVWAKWGFSQQNVIAILKKNGCTGWSGQAELREHEDLQLPGRWRALVRLHHDVGQPASRPDVRDHPAAVEERRHRVHGAVHLAGRALRGRMLTSGDWEVVLFTFVGGPTGSETFFGIGGCGGDQNYNASCNAKATALLKKAQFTADAADREKLLHAAEELLAEEVFVVPLFSRPTKSCGRSKVKGPIRNPTQQGSTWNAEAWTITGSIDSTLRAATPGSVPFRPRRTAGAGLRSKIRSGTVLTYRHSPTSLQHRRAGRGEHPRLLGDEHGHEPDRVPEGAAGGFRADHPRTSRTASTSTIRSTSGTATGSTNAVTNEFGTETVSYCPIFPDLKRAIVHTLQLVVIAELLALLFASGSASIRHSGSTACSTTRRRHSASSGLRYPSSGLR